MRLAVATRLPFSSRYSISVARRRWLSSSSAASAPSRSCTKRRVRSGSPANSAASSTAWKAVTVPGRRRLAIATLAVSAASRWVRRKPVSPCPGAPRAIETPSAFGAAASESISSRGTSLSRPSHAHIVLPSTDSISGRPASRCAEAAVAARSSRGSTCGSSGVGTAHSTSPM